MTLWRTMRFTPDDAASACRAARRGVVATRGRPVAEELDDRGAAPQRFRTPDLELAVITEGLRELVQPELVARPVVGGERVADAFGEPPAPSAP